MGALALLVACLLLQHALASGQCDQSSCMCRGTCKKSPVHCFGLKLENVSQRPLASLDGIQHNTSHFLLAWESVLGHVHQCWPKLQALLCTVAWPPCVDGADGADRVMRPSTEMCRLTINSCPILKDLFKERLPNFLKCDQYKPQKDCRNVSVSTPSYHEFVKDNNRTCRKPLVRTLYKKNWFPSIDDCGYGCQTPLFTQHEYKQARFLIPCLALVCLFVNIFVCITFLLDWRSWSRYPRIIVFYIHCCFLFGCLGWLAQFLPSAYHDIVCRKDGTPRRAEPQLNSGESVTCSLVFALIYFTLMAVGSWFVLFLSAICPRLQPLAAAGPDRRFEGSDGASRKSPRRVRKARTPSRLVCHLLAWILPSVLTIICLTVGEIDGDPLLGICFVGHSNIGARVGLLFVPLCFSTTAALLLLLRILGLQWVLLTRARQCNLDAVECEGGRVAVAELRRSRTSMSIFIVVVFSIFAYAVGIQLYLFVNQGKWDTSVRQTILCEMQRDLVMTGAVSLPSHTSVYLMGTGLESDRCEVDARPNVSLLLLYVVCYFASNLTLTSLVCDRRVLGNWKLLWSRVTGSCWRRLNGGYSASPRCEPSSAPSSHSLVEPSKPRGANSFSWWDVGLFPVQEAGPPNGGESAPPGDSEGSELISSSRLEMASKATGPAGMLAHGFSHLPHSAHVDYRGHRRSGSLSSARTTPTLGGGEENYGPGIKRGHRSSGRNGDRRPPRRPSQRRHDRGDIRRSMSDCSSTSSAAVQWRGSWGSVQSYNSYNPQRGVLEERYANWRVQAALNWTSSMAPYYSHTGLPLNFAWQTPVGIPVGSGPATPGYWGYPPMLWPVYMVGPAMPPAGPAPKANGVQSAGLHPTPGHVTPRDDVIGARGAAAVGTPQGSGSRRRARGSAGSDDFNSEDEVESMNSDAFDSEDEVESGQEASEGQEEGEEAESDDESSVECQE